MIIICNTIVDGVGGECGLGSKQDHSFPKICQLGYATFLQRKPPYFELI